VAEFYAIMLKKARERPSCLLSRTNEAWKYVVYSNGVFSKYVRSSILVFSFPICLIAGLVHEASGLSDSSQRLFIELRLAFLCCLKVLWFIDFYAVSQDVAVELCVK
jgi:hypothetical protein